MDPLITLQLIAPKLQRACGGPWRRRISMYADTFVYLRQKDRGNAVGSWLNYCSTKSTWQLAVFSMERSVPPPPPVCFFFLLVKDACMSVLWARASLLFAYNPCLKAHVSRADRQKKWCQLYGYSHQRDRQLWNACPPSPLPSLSVSHSTSDHLSRCAVALCHSLSRNVCF